MTRAAACLFALMLLTGCSSPASDRPKTVPVAGVVLKGGQPLAKVSVAFISSAGQMAMGTTDDKGQFKLTTSQPDDGATVGDHKVSLGYVTESPISNSPEELAKTAQVKSPVPARYGDANTSGLTATVPPAGKTDFKFEIAD